MTDLYDRFFGESNEIDPEALQGEYRTILEGWAARWRARTGVAFLPRKSGDEVSWYGLTPGGAERRELEGLLVHWLGASYTDLEQRRGLLDPGDPFDSWLEGELPGRVVRFEVWPRHSVESRPLVRDRLDQLVKLLDRRPQRPPLNADRLSALLDDMHKAAVAGDRVLAREILDDIADRRLLDSTNQRFLLIQMLEAAQAWREILSPEQLVALSGLRLPNGVTRAVLRAVFEVHLADLGSDVDRLRDAAQGIPEEVPAIAVQTTAETREVAIVQALLLGDRPDVVEHLRTLDADVLPQGFLSGKPSVPAPVADRDGFYAAMESYDHAAVLRIAALLEDLSIRMLQECVMSAGALATRQAAETALDLVQIHLGEPAEVSWPTPQVEQEVGRLLTRTKLGTPNSWAEWMTLALTGDTRARVELDTSTWPPAPPAEMSGRIDEIPPETLQPVLGRLISAHRSAFTLQQLADTALSGLLGLSAVPGRSGADRAVISQLASDVLDADGHVAVADLVDVLDGLVVAHLGSASVPWAIDLLAELSEAVVGTDRDVVAGFTQRLLNLLRPLWNHVSRSDVDALLDIAESLGTSVPDDLMARFQETEEEPPYAWVRGNRILLYSLRERPARRAASLLRGLGANTVVDLRHDHVATDALSNASREADVIVIVKYASTHPATDSIEAVSRPDQRRYAESVGTSSILKCIRK